ncbi:MAG: hypothetical protein ACOC03_03505 [Desulfosalsimonas sp.]
MFRSKKNEGSVIGGVFIAFFILIFHVVLLALIGVLVLFLGGLLNYLPWILLGGLVLLIGSGYLMLRRLAAKSEAIVKVLDLPELKGKNIELKVMGGLASVKISNPEDRYRLPVSGEMRIEDEEYKQAKQRLVE